MNIIKHDEILAKIDEAIAPALVGFDLHWEEGTPSEEVWGAIQNLKNAGVIVETVPDPGIWHYRFLQDNAKAFLPNASCIHRVYRV